MVLFAILQFEIFFLIFENTEITSVFLLMLSGKQENHWYYFVNVFGMTRPLAGVIPWTSHTRSQHSITRLSLYLQ